jgi:RNase P/RNase MRP subunit p30
MYDLNVRSPSQRDKEMKSLVKRALELGWDCVAWNVSIAGKIGNSGAKPIKPPDLDPVLFRDVQRQRALAMSNVQAAKFRQISRLTVTVDEVIDAHALTAGNETLRTFDIVAARAGNSKVFAYLCRHADIDVITIDFTHRLPFLFNKKLLDEAVSRGISFEVNYSSILGAAGARREVFSNTRVILQYLRGRNIIISSGAESTSLLRGPFDVCNIACVLGLTQQQAQNAIGENCASVLKHALARRCRYLPVEIVSKAEFKKRWPELTLAQPHPSSQPSEGSLKKVKSLGNMSTISSTASASGDSVGDDDSNDDGSEASRPAEEADVDGGDGVNTAEDAADEGSKAYGSVDNNSVADGDSSDDSEYMKIDGSDDEDIHKATSSVARAVNKSTKPQPEGGGKVSVAVEGKSRGSTMAGAKSKQPLERDNAVATESDDDSDFSLGDSDDDDGDENKGKEGKAVVDISKYDDKASRGLGSDDFISFGDDDQKSIDDSDDGARYARNPIAGLPKSISAASTAPKFVKAKGSAVKSGGAGASTALLVGNKKESKKRQRQEPSALSRGGNNQTVKKSR